jgi:hypothetical protein
VGVVPGIRALHNPAQTGSERGRLVLLGDLADQATSRQLAASGGRGVGAVEMDARSTRQLSEWLQGIEGRLQEAGASPCWSRAPAIGPGLCSILHPNFGEFTLPRTRVNSIRSRHYDY